jgi:hypothetical protein
MTEPSTPPRQAGGSGRMDIKLGDWEPPDNFKYPHLEPDGGIRTVEHDVLAEETVVQEIGENAERFTLRGHGYATDLYRLRQMRSEIVTIQHPVYWGDVLVENVSGSHDSSWDEGGWTYTYTVQLIGVPE